MSFNFKRANALNMLIYSVHFGYSSQPNQKGQNGCGVRLGLLHSFSSSSSLLLTSGPVLKQSALRANYCFQSNTNYISIIYAYQPSLPIFLLYVNGKIIKIFIFCTLSHNCYFTYFHAECQWLIQKNCPKTIHTAHAPQPPISPSLPKAPRNQLSLFSILPILNKFKHKKVPPSLASGHQTEYINYCHIKRYANISNLILYHHYLLK